MDLIEKIKEILKKSGLSSPSFDLRYDDKYNIIGYVADAFFEDKGDRVSQEFIWNSLKKYLAKEELSKISSIFHESPREAAERLIENRFGNNSHSNFWLHSTPDLTRYWLFLSVEEFENEYKSFFLIINEKEKFKKGLTYVYSQEVLEFMELKQKEDILEELFTNTFGNAENEIKFHLMQKYDRLMEKGYGGKENKFSYVFENFHIYPIPKSQLLFDEFEIKMISEAIKPLTDFNFTKEIEIAIHQSSLINNSKEQL